MRGVVKQSLAVAGPQTPGNDFMRFDGPCVYDHPRAPKMVPKENIIDNRQGHAKDTTDGKATDLPPVPTNDYKIPAIGHVAQRQQSRSKSRDPKRTVPAKILHCL